MRPRRRVDGHHCADFVQDVQAVADPAAQTFVAAEGVELPAAFYYELK